MSILIQHIYHPLAHPKTKAIDFPFLLHSPPKKRLARHETNSHSLETDFIYDFNLMSISR